MVKKFYFKKVPKELRAGRQKYIRKRLIYLITLATPAPQ